jgi:hypothetical protein
MTGNPRAPIHAHARTHTDAEQNTAAHTQAVHGARGERLEDQSGGGAISDGVLPLYTPGRGRTAVGGARVLAATQGDGAGGAVHSAWQAPAVLPRRRRGDRHRRGPPHRPAAEVLAAPSLHRSAPVTRPGAHADDQALLSRR